LRPASLGDEVYYALTKGAQKGGATNFVVAVRAAPRAKPLCQP
jgi:hypothetical protein